MVTEDVDSLYADEPKDINELLILCKTVESVMNLTRARCLLPLHFRNSILLYSFTGSRFALKKLGCSGAHGSYDSVRSVNTDELAEFGDVNIAFDNNQVLHRQWNVHIESKFRCHMVTMVVSFIIDGTGDLQTKHELKPVNWMQTPSDKGCHVRNIDKLPEVKDTHYDHF